MRPFTATILGATTLLSAAAAPAATVTITDCGAAPVEKVGKRTVISRPADDVTIQCALLPLAGTTRIEITARSLTVDGAEGGSIVAAGKGLAIEIVTIGTNADVRKWVRSAHPRIAPVRAGASRPCSDGRPGGRAARAAPRTKSRRLDHPDDLRLRARAEVVAGVREIDARAPVVRRARPDGDVFGVARPHTVHRERRDDRAGLADREQRELVAGVVVRPVDAGMPPARGHAGQLGERARRAPGMDRAVGIRVARAVRGAGGAAEERKQDERDDGPEPPSAHRPPLPAPCASRMRSSAPPRRHM